MTLILDTLEGSSAVRDKDGIKVARGFLIRGLSGSTSDKLARVFNTSGLPTYNAPHPTIPNIFVQNISVRSIPEGSDLVRGAINYGPRTVENRPPDDNEEPQIEIGSSSITVETNLDFAGSLLKVFYRKTIVDANGAETVENRKQTGRVEKTVPTPFVRIQRRERQSSINKVFQYVDHVNSSTFLGFPARTVLCTSITSRSDDGGRNFITNYEFQIKRDSWDVVIAYQDPDDENRVPEDVSFDNGLSVAQVYPPANFNRLRLD